MSWQSGFQRVGLTAMMLCAVALCSCRTTKNYKDCDPAGRPRRMPHGAGSNSGAPPFSLPEAAYTGAPQGPISPTAGGLPLPYDVRGEWAPPGIMQPWPQDEYLRDGGDSGLPVEVAPDWKVYGLDIEDTVAHYDALDGRTLVEESNRVHIYAPRFGAVRTVTRVEAGEQIDQPNGVESPTRLARSDLLQSPTSHLKQARIVDETGTKMLNAFRMKQGDGVLSASLPVRGLQDMFMPFENLQIIKAGIHQDADKARLAQSVDAAIIWTKDQAVQVVLNGRTAGIINGDQRVQATFTVDDLRDSPKLRIIKVASTQTAQPGDTIDFTLRFDNVGDQPIGNIVLIDSLTSRLEYVPDSAQSSVQADFRTDRNEAESLILRWEVADPLHPGQGGIVRFRCLVR
jgi:uncharacterized repeat protein (TIGR01451 family)